VKGFRKVKAHPQLPLLRSAPIARQERLAKSTVAPSSRAT